MEVKEGKVVLDDCQFVLNTYIAKDGKEFNFKVDCIKHEATLDINHIPFKKCNYMGFNNWYFIKSIDDIIALKKYIIKVVYSSSSLEFDSVYNKHFLGKWVSYNIEYDNDSNDFCELTTYEEVKENFEQLQKDFETLNKCLAE